MVNNKVVHYNQTSIETIEKIRRIWGDVVARQWCEITAFKYRDRLGHKTKDIHSELQKILDYERFAFLLYQYEGQYSFTVRQLEEKYFGSY